MEELNADIELKQSRSGKTVPVVGGIYLHSIYNPEKEAQAFASNYENSIKSKSHILMLGLGFGYHVEEVAKLAAKYHETFKIVVLEPNQKLVQAHNEAGGFDDSRIEVINASRPTEVFENYEFIMFLSQKPAILRHESSFNLSKAFFKEFLTFKAPTNMNNFSALMSDNARSFFPVKESSVDQAIESAKTTGRLKDKKDFAFFVLEAVVNSAKQTTQR